VILNASFGVASVKQRLLVPDQTNLGALQKRYCAAL